jgi:hypothetical protein
MHVVPGGAFTATPPLADDDTLPRKLCGKFLDPNSIKLRRDRSNSSSNCGAGSQRQARLLVASQPFRWTRCCKTMPTSVPQSSMQWHRWFAWRPVIVYSRAGRWRVAWLQDVERRWSLGITSGLRPRRVYRKVQDDDT